MRRSLSASRPRRSKVSLANSQGSVAGKDLRTTSWAVEYSVRQVAHLRMTALAGVATQNIGQGSYLLQGSENCTIGRQSA